MPARILVVDDERTMCESIELALKKRGYEVSWRTSAKEAFDAMGTEEHDVVVTDINMRGESGIDLCQRIVANRPNVPVIIMTAFGSLETAIQAIRAGAFDFVTKPFEMEQLTIAIERALQTKSLREEVKRLRRGIDGAQKFEDIIGKSTVMQKVFDLVSRIGDLDATVLVTGESGTGKEVIARALHYRSKRKNGTFVAINCAAMPEALLESELFGHTKGAFTDARTQKKGLFVEADGGTLFLDEIGNLPISLQPKLLRALETHLVRPLGATAEVKFDARIIAATNRDLETAVAEKRFREDLFYRINVVHVELPPLRARGADILILAQHFVARSAERLERNVKGMSPGVAEKLLAYSWPGNVRELSNCIERAVALARFEELTVEDLPEKIRAHEGTHVIAIGEDPTELVSLEEIERRYILRVMEAVSGNKTTAARLLGLDRTTLYRKLDRYGYGNEDGKRT